MHPPWITFTFLLLLLAIRNTVSKDAQQNEADNSTVSRPQRETYERERRLIPYMTYYVTPSLNSPNGGARQNIIIPVAAPRNNIYQFGVVPNIPLANVQNESPQPIEVLSKPVARLTSPSLLTPINQLGNYKQKEGGIFPQIYRLDGIAQSRIQPQVQTQQIQSETQPLQVIKVNPMSAEQKYSAPRLIKIVPLITKLPLEDKTPKSFSPQHSHFVYQGGKVHTLTHHPSTENYPNYYTESPIRSQTENPFRGSKVYPSPVSQENGLLGSTLRPETNKYTIAKIIFATTPSPHNSFKYSESDGTVSSVENNVQQVLIGQPRDQDPAQIEYGRSSALAGASSFAAPDPHQLVYAQTANDDSGQGSEDIIQGQKIVRLPKLRVPEEEKIRFVASVTHVPVTNDLESAHWKINNEGAEKKYSTEIPSNLLSLLKETNKLPQNLTPDNIDTGIKTLALILERLQQQKSFYQAQKISTSSISTTPEAPTATIAQSHQNPKKKVHSFPEKSGTSTPGRPGIDYPTYSSIPQTNFDCSTQRYKGFFGDPDTKCQVWHYCDLNGGQASFLCPNGTIFSQVALTCDWWFNVKCASTSQLYVLNERLYKYILPFSPSFPEDYSGPIVDTYLEAKFKEMEAKSKSKALKSPTNSTTTEKPAATGATTDASTESAEDLETHSAAA